MRVHVTSGCVCVCVDICLCMRVCVRATVRLSGCCVFMRGRGHLCVCASVCVRVRVDMYVSLLFCNAKCTIFILTITVQFGMDIQYIMTWKVWYCF